MPQLYIVIVCCIVIVWMTCKLRQLRIQVHQDSLLKQESNFYETLNLIPKERAGIIRPEYRRIKTWIIEEAKKDTHDFWANRGLNLVLRTRQLFNEDDDVLDADLDLAIFSSLAERSYQKSIDARNKSEYNRKFIGENTQYNSDPQNTHDSQVGKDLVVSYRRISDGADWDTGVSETFESITRYIEGLENTPKNERAKKAVRQMIESNTHMTLIGAHETEILRDTWNRSNHPRNRENRENIREAIIDQLADCVDGNNVVCATGRVSRVIASLATLDYDPQVGKCATSDAYKNEALDKANQIMNRAIREYKTSDDEEKRRYAASFDDPKATFNEAVREEFEKRVVGEVSDYIDQNQEHLPHDMKQKIIDGLVF
jgi:hypothetical protein